MRISPRPASVVLGLFVTLLAVHPASAQSTTVEFIDQSVQVGSNLSGVRGGQNATLVPSSNFAWLVTGVFFRERQNVPCYVRVEFARLGAGGDGAAEVGVNQIFDRCDGRSSAGSERGQGVTFYGGDPQYVIDEVSAVRSLTACLRQSNDRLKGIRVSGSDVTRDGVQSGTTGGAGNATSPNCNNNWQAESRCREDRIATKVRVFHAPVSGIGAAADRQVTGLRLICQRVRLTP